MKPRQLVALTALSLIMLSGCGKNGRPEAPTADVFPRPYPSATLAGHPSVRSQTSSQFRVTDPFVTKTRSSQGHYIDPSVSVPVLATSVAGNVVIISQPGLLRVPGDGAASGDDQPPRPGLYPLGFSGSP